MIVGQRNCIGLGDGLCDLEQAMVIGEPLDHFVKIEEAKEEALDSALDMNLGATCNDHPVSKGQEPAKHVSKEVVVATQSPTTSQLSFAFPGWEIGTSKGVKRKKRSIPRLINDTQWAPSKRGKEVKSPDTAGPSTGSLALEDLNAPVEGCPIEDSMDDELLACVFMRLNMKDLSASMRTCKRWHRVACKEDVWEHIPLPANVPGALPRSIRALAWLCTTFGG